MNEDTIAIRVRRALTFLHGQRADPRQYVAYLAPEAWSQAIMEAREGHYGRATGTEYGPLGAGITFWGFLPGKEDPSLGGVEIELRHVVSA